MKNLNLERLDYQQEAIENIVGVLRSVKIDNPKHRSGNPTIDLNYSRDRIFANICDIREESGITHGKEEPIENTAKYLEIDTLMETGTGKTLTFIETIYRLNEKYGMTKFLIFVPSRAIKYGTINTIKTSAEHFYKHYARNIKLFDDIGNIHGFIHSGDKNICVYVTSHQGFSSSKNIINRGNIEQRLVGNTANYRQAIAELNPIIIIDEPHKFEGEKTTQAIPNFNPQMILRFGATYRTEPKNLVYALDSMTAFTKNLVKGIKVQSIGTTITGKHSLKYIGCKGEKADKVAEIQYAKTDDDKQTIQVKKNESVGIKLGLSELDDLIVDKIINGEVEFKNNTTLKLGAEEAYSAISKQIQKDMLSQTIDSHFEKEEFLFNQGIKSLSLIFIHGVSSYDLGKGYLAKTFEELYKKKLKKVLQGKISDEYRAYLERSKDDVKKVHHGYFAKSKGLKDEKDAIDLILNKKSELLSKDTDLRFIFSMWALQEGWDNPNIFTICKLAPSDSRITKLQQIGRGLRLAVRETHSGFERITEDEAESEYDFREINELTVIIPESEKEFAESIQVEIKNNSLRNIVHESLNAFLLRTRGVCKNNKIATGILYFLDAKGIVEFDDEGENALIKIEEDEIDGVIAELQNAGHEFDAEKLAELFKRKEKLDDKIKTSSGAKEKTIKINKHHWAKFEKLWKEINQEAVYTFDINEKKLVKECIKAINAELDIKQARIRMKEYEKVDERGGKDVTEREIESINVGFYTLEEFIKQIINATKLSSETIEKILMGISKEKFDEIKKDEVEAIGQIKNICRMTIYKHIKTSLSYEINMVEIRETAFELMDENHNPKDEILAKKLGRKIHKIENKNVKQKSLMKDLLGYDSKSEVDVIEASHHDEIIVFTKLPRIKIPVPGGETYSPDFAYVVSGKDTKKSSLHLIVENKGVKDKDGLRYNEKRKIDMAKKYFENLQKQNPDIHYEVRYEKNMLKGEELGDIIEEIRKKQQ